jgi:hypothetical protein
MIKNKEMLGKAYKIINTYFGMRKKKCAYIKDKDGSILIEEEKIGDRWKEYVEYILYEDYHVAK